MAPFVRAEEVHADPLLRPAVSERLIGEGVAERFELQLGDDLWVARPRRPSKFVCEDGKLVKKRISADVPTPWKYEVVGILTACLAGLGVLNGQLLAALERSRELGVLKALGTSRGQVAGLVLLEALVVALVSALYPVWRTTRADAVRAVRSG